MIFARVSRKTLRLNWVLLSANLLLRRAMTHIILVPSVRSITTSHLLLMLLWVLGFANGIKIFKNVNK